MPGLKLTPFNCSIKMSVYYIASLKINHFIAQNLGNKAKPRDHNPPEYFRSQKYPGDEVDSTQHQLISEIVNYLKYKLKMNFDTV